MLNVIQKENVKSRLEKYDEIVWTFHESSFRNRWKRRKVFLANNSITLTMALLVKLRKSNIGIFLEHFNKQQVQNTFVNSNKYDIMMYDYKDITKEQQDMLNINDNVTNEFMKLILYGATNANVIDWEFLYSNFNILRLSNLYVS